MIHRAKHQANRGNDTSCTTATSRREDILPERSDPLEQKSGSLLPGVDHQSTRIPDYLLIFSLPMKLPSPYSDVQRQNERIQIQWPPFEKRPLILA